MIYTGTKLIEILEKQHESRGQSDLLKKGTFTIQWRAKVGSFPHPDGETIVPAGELCGTWKHNNTKKLNVGDNLQHFEKLPLNAYIPGSSIRGLVRAWAKIHPEIKPRMEELLGYQDEQNICAGKVEFLDAYPQEPTKITLDIVNPQQDFQVYHDGQSKPLSFYTLGDGKKQIPITVAIRGIPNRITSEELTEVWRWVEQALCFYGVGGRTASGYGVVKTENIKVDLPENYARKSLDFSLYSQGSYGANQKQGNEDLRPSHWRGWLRSWILRFLLGVMSKENAEKTLGELLGTIGTNDNSTACKGCVRIRMIRGSNWGEKSSNQPNFYCWKGRLEIIAPKDILNDIILSILRFAVSLGGVGRGWRRPLHIFTMNNGQVAARGTHLLMTHKVKDKTTGELKNQSFALPPTKANIWQNTYQKWLDAVRLKWSNRVQVGINNNLAAEVFSPTTCAIYTVPAPVEEPIDFKALEWNITKPINTRGDGMNLIYKEESPQNYKRNRDLGGDAGREKAYCSWVSIKRVNVPNQEEDTDCQEVVCLFMGGKTAQDDHVRSRFLADLKNISSATHLFGV
jgi:CRISPR-associated protein Cmr6